MSGTTGEVMMPVATTTDLAEYSPCVVSTTHAPLSCLSPVTSVQARMGNANLSAYLATYEVNSERVGNRDV